MFINIVFYNATICTGSCGYCTARLDLPSLKNASKIDVNILEAVNRRLSNLIEFDFDKMEQMILTHQGADDPKWTFSIWGGDPLASFDCFAELYEFLMDLGKRHNKEVEIGGSTNGLAFANPKWTEWLLSKDNIHMQLSHDGLGQYIRTNDIDPLALDCMEDVWNHKTLRSINCVLNQLNFSPKANLRYFDQFPFLRNIRMYSARDEIYKIPIKCNGWLNGVRMPKLIGYEVTDMAIHNDPSKLEFAHAADTFFDEYYWMGERIRAGYLKKYAHSYIRRVKDVSSKNKPKPSCAKWHLGMQDWSNCIDTMGFFTECHLMDHRDHVPNKEMKKPEKCKGCRFIDSTECNYCGRTNLSESQCQHNWRLNLWAEHFKDLTNKV